ncbi:MAG: T9SS type A sorting domain-containing protein [Lentimicrobium sp.]
MKKLFSLLSMLIIMANLNAQYIYTDFDANQNVVFGGWPNAPTAVANPDATGLNTSANVGEWIRSGEQWAHVFTELDGKIDFSTGEIFSIKVWSPIACNVLFKLEDKTNGGVFVELSQPVTSVNEWVGLSFNFDGAGSSMYDKIVIFMDFASTTSNTFYFDDVEGPEYSGGTVNDPIYLPVTFENEELNYGLTDFGGTASEIVVDPDNNENKVAKTIKTESAETWAGTTVGGNIGFGSPIPFAVGETFMTVEVWSPEAGTPVRLKVEAANDPTISVETEATTTVANGWQTLVFDFSNEATGTAELNFAYSYNKASIFFNFGTTGAAAGEQTYYWDDMKFGLSVGLEHLDAASKNVVVFPNPAENILYIRSESALSKVAIFNIAGLQVKDYNDVLQSIDVSDLKKGIYMIRLTDVKNRTISSEFIKK